MDQSARFVADKPTPNAAKPIMAKDERSGLSKALAFYSAYSWRGRIGLIAPSTNTTLEPEFKRMTPDGVAVYVSRVHQSGVQGDIQSYQRMADGIATASTLLATSEVDVIAFGCTSCTYFVEPAMVRNAMRENAGCFAVLTADAVLAALRALNLKHIAVVGPRTELVTKREVEFLVESGLEITAARCLGLGAVEEERRAIGRVPPETVYRLAVSADSNDAEAIFVSCTQLPTLALIEPLERMLKKPIITSNQATMWRCLRAIKFGDPIPGFGRLLSENPQAPN